MSKRLGLLIVMMLFVTMMTGCFGSDDSTTPTPATTSSVVITGTIPALSAPAGAPNKMVNYGTNYEMGVFNAATMAEITGSAVVINGTTYTATVPAGAANVTALIVIRHKTTGKVVYSAIAGNLPTTTQMSAASVTKVTVSGVNLNGESTALATIAKDKGVAAPSIPVSTSVTTMPATVKSTIDTAVGTATITAIRDAVEAVQTVLNASSVPETVKSSILSALDAALSNVLNAFVTAVKDASAVITSAGGATTVTVGGTTINSTTTPAQVTDAVNHVTVVTVSAVTNPSDIAVANGTAVSAIQFPTTVTVTLSNGQTATKNVVWSTTSTPAYNATVSGTYAFTGTVDGTTLKATVKVNVGIIQLKVATPTFTPAAGTFTAAQSVTIATTTEGATIYYTTDGSTPTTSSSVYASAINVAATTTIKAIATKTGMTTSDVASALYTINISLIPVISAERAVKQANGDVVVTWTTNIVTPTAAKLIVSGDIPNPSYPSVLETVSTTTSHSVTIPAAKLAENSAYTKLVISYVIGEDGTTASIAKSAIIEAAQVVADPVFAPVAGTYTTAQSVTITCATEGAEIYYTTDGSAPSSLTTKYTGAIALSTSATTNFKAIAVKTGMTDSNVVSATYVLNISTTKVLTGIALAKATDTVEAETAYTLPTAKASYDDNSVPADVTVSWVEVLAGGTSAVTLPVTKTTAGTYNFQASYTENGVTKTADFVLVVTEKVPVKTLDSLTVTATPAAPTCLVGGTATVALKVVANYLTGTVASTEEVTTFTTGSNWANGVFTASVTAAGTENIVVSFGGKTANVAVTVTVAPPVDPIAPTYDTTAVTVGANNYTLTLNFSEAVKLSDTAAVTIVQSGVTFTTKATVNATDSKKIDLVVDRRTSAPYAPVNSILSQVDAKGVSDLAGNNLSVTTTTYTPNDTTIPSLVSVSTSGSTTLYLVFSENVYIDNTAATNVALTYIASSTGNQDLQNYNITYSGTTATVTLQKELLNGDYYFVIKAGKATDFGGNSIGYTSKAFSVSGLADNKPTLTSAVYNNYTGLLTLGFSEAIDNNTVSATKITITGANASTYTLVAGDYTGVVATDNSIVTNNLSSKLTALTQSFKVTLAADAVTDATGNTNIAMTTPLTVTHSNAPVLTSAKVDEKAAELTLVFDKAVTAVTSGTKTGVVLKLTGAVTAGVQTTYTSGTNMTLTAKSTNVDGTSQVFLISGAAFIANTTITAATISIPVDLYTSTDSTSTQTLKNNAQTDVTATYTDDSTAPKITAAAYNSLTKQITLTFDEKVTGLTASGGTLDNITYSLKSDGTAAAGLDGYTALDSTNAPTYVLTMSGNAPNAIDAAFDAPVDPASVYLVFNASVVDGTGNPMAVADRIFKATMTDLTPPKANVLDGVPAAADNLVQATDKNHITVVFNEKVLASTATNTANYAVAATANPAQTLSITSAVLMADEKTVVLTTADQLSIDYTLTISNVKDQSPAGNTIVSATAVTLVADGADANAGGTGNVNNVQYGTKSAYGSTFTALMGSAATPTAVKLSGTASYTDDNNDGLVNAGDKITVTFTTDIKDIAYSVADFQLFESDGSALTVPSTETFGTGATVARKAVDATDANYSKKVVITLGTNPVFNTLISGTSYNPTSNDIDVSTTTTIKSLTDVVATKDTAPHDIVNTSATTAVNMKTVTFTDVNGDGIAGSGDTLVITYDVPVVASYNAADSTAALKATALAAAFRYNKDNDTTYDDALPTGTTGALSTDGKTLTLTLGGELASTGAFSNIGIRWTGNVTKLNYSATGGAAGSGKAVLSNSWSLENGTTAATVASSETTAVGPKLTNAKYYSSSKTLELVFDQPIGVGAVTENQFALYNFDFDSTGANQSVGTMSISGTTLFVTLGGNSSILSGATINIASSGVTLITDVYGNVATASAAAIAVTPVDDTTRPYLVSATFVDVNGDGAISAADKVNFLFNKAVRDTTSSAAADYDTAVFNLADASFGGAGIAVAWSGDMKTLTITLGAAPIGITFNTVFKPKANVIADLSGNFDNTVFDVKMSDTFGPKLTADSCDLVGFGTQVTDGDGPLVALKATAVFAAKAIPTITITNNAALADDGSDSTFALDGNGNLTITTDCAQVTGTELAAQYTAAASAAVKAIWNVTATGTGASLVTAQAATAATEIAAGTSVVKVAYAEALDATYSLSSSTIKIYDTTLATARTIGTSPCTFFSADGKTIYLMLGATNTVVATDKLTEITVKDATGNTGTTTSAAGYVLD